MKAVVAAFNQEKALVGAFSVIVQPVGSVCSTILHLEPDQHHRVHREHGQAVQREGREVDGGPGEVQVDADDLRGVEGELDLGVRDESGDVVVQPSLLGHALVSGERCSNARAFMCPVLM